MTVILENLPPAQEQAWLLLLRLADTRYPWVLIGGQLIHLLAAEHGALLPRVTLDADILVNVRASAGSIAKVCAWLESHDLTLEGASPDGVGHRFSKPADPGPGQVSFDVLAPEGLGERMVILTRAPFRTVNVPGSQSLITRAETIEVIVVSSVTGTAHAGRVHRPTVLAALIGKAAATGITGRVNPGRDWQDAALLLSLLPDPVSARTSLSRGERKNLARVKDLASNEHPAWAVLPPQARRQGLAAARLLLGD